MNADTCILRGLFVIMFFVGLSLGEFVFWSNESFWLEIRDLNIFILFYVYR